MKNKKAIKKLKREIAYLNDAHDAIHALTAYQNQDIDEFKRQNQTNKELIGVLNEKLNSVILRADNVSELKSELEHHKSKIKELFDFTQSVARHLGYAETDIKTIAKHVQNLEAEKEKNCSCHINTQKTDKNATEGKQEGKKEYSETIVTNEMFNEELERFFRLEKVLTPYIKYTSTKNTPEYIASLIYALDERTNCPQAIGIIRSKLKDKGEHYNKESDRYANIKDALKRNKEEEPHLFANWTVVDKINSYKDKHVQWLIDTKGTVQTKTDLQEAYIDVICYCIMCYIYLKFNGESKNG